MARNKPKALVIESLEHADEVLSQLAGHQRDLAEVERAMNEEIDLAKQTAKLKGDPIKSKIKELATALNTFAAFKKTELFSGKKSVELTFGTLGYRKSTKLKTLARWTWKKVLERITELDLLDAVRTKEEVDKEELNRWPDERLETVGVQRVTKDEFYFELKAEELEGEVS